MNVKFVGVFLFIATMFTGYECAATNYKGLAKAAVGRAAAAKTCWDWKVKHSTNLAAQENALHRAFKGKKHKRHFDIFATCCVSSCTEGADSCKNDCKKQNSTRINYKNVEGIGNLTNCKGELRTDGKCDKDKPHETYNAYDPYDRFLHRE